ncbi:MAG: CDP-diacylglycerol--glycerol-3-phosphate 3-phosphatidyltransferase [Candidatus Hydrogenedentes bacterium]|nr:CDP-diacylglycerol--glycerol-3-phosphate 3-phosphatidyltransferase [Candidatus Hydrogenedentota bacterium]
MTEKSRAVTDYYDGKIARERGLVTNFGKLLDPVADKVLITSAFIMMMKVPELMIPGWTIVVILAREFLVTGARALAAAEGEVIAANVSGKTKTVFQLVYVFTFLFFAMAFRFLDLFPRIWDYAPGGRESYVTVIGYMSLVAMVLVALYTVYSGIHFAQVNWKTLKLDNLS